MYVIKVLVCDDKNAKQNICSITNSLKIYKGLYSNWEEDNTHKFYMQSFSSSLKELLFQRIFPEIPGRALVFLSSESEGKQVWYPRYLAVISDDYELVKAVGRHLASIKVCVIRKTLPFPRHHTVSWRRQNLWVQEIVTEQLLCTWLILNIEIQ